MLGNVTVTGNAGGPFTIVFNNALADTDIPQLVASDAGAGNSALTAVTNVGAGNEIQVLTVGGTATSLNLSFAGVTNTIPSDVASALSLASVSTASALSG